VAEDTKAREPVKITLAHDEYDLLYDTLINHSDEGPAHEGWKSDNLKRLINSIDISIGDNPTFYMGEDCKCTDCHPIYDHLASGIVKAALPKSNKHDLIRTPFASIDKRGVFADGSSAAYEAQVKPIRDRLVTLFKEVM